MPRIGCLRAMIVSALAFLIIPAVFAQPRRDEPSGRRIEGVVVDGESGDPLPAANVLLFRAGVLSDTAAADDDTALRGAATDIDGRFIIPVSDSGEYDLRVRVLGYTPATVRGIEVSDAQPRAQAGRIALTPTSLQLEQVNYSVRGTDVQLAPDRKVYRVSDNIADAGGSVSDALEEIPSVVVDVEGNVSLRGNENVRILIDGKPSSRVGLNSAEALRQLPAELVDRIEVMTNPGAKYEAEGNAGIINIVLKREREEGLNGSVSVSTGAPLRGGVGVNLNYRVGRFNLFANEGLNYRSHDGGGDTYQEYYGAGRPYASLDQSRRFDRGGGNNDIRVGVEYLASDSDTWTLSVFNEYSESTTDGRIEYLYYTDSGGLGSHIERNNPEDETERWNGLDFGYRHTFGDPVDGNGNGAHEFTADYQFETGSEHELSNVTETRLAGGGDNLVQHVSNHEGETRHLVKADYVHPWSKEHKFELGARSELKVMDHEYGVFEQPSGAQLDVSNHLIYRENVHAAYLSFANRLGDHFSYQAGLRGEYSDVSTELADSSGTYAREYFDLFPSLHLNYDFNPVNTLQASYTRRLRRPHHWYLVPFWNYADSRNIRRGNPNLDPEYTDSYELGHVFHRDHGSLSSSVYYRHTTGEIEWYETANDSVTVSQPYNIGTEDAYGFEFVVIQQFARWLNVQGSLNIFRVMMDGSFGGENYETDDFTWFTRASTRVMFNKATQLQVRLFYRGARETLQGKRRPVVSLDLGLSRSFMSDTFTISANLRDALDTRRWETETWADSFYSRSDFQWRGRTFTIQLTWRFNQDERDKRRRGRGGMDFGDDFEGGGIN
ncbi:MAG: Vitamin B12 transporter BtuB [Calditrichaeota bacterium]|nr:Vitamin B12 transporter BtuB [Calditrichota bacterium]